MTGRTKKPRVTIAGLQRKIENLELAHVASTRTLQRRCEEEARAYEGRIDAVAECAAQQRQEISTLKAQAQTSHANVAKSRERLVLAGRIIERLKGWVIANAPTSRVEVDPSIAGMVPPAKSGPAVLDVLLADLYGDITP